MYNGIGLQTARGSGTNGYVQANRANLQLSKKRVAYNSEADIKRAEASLLRKPNAELLEHMKKRQIELKCADFELLMENKGFGEAEIEKKVSEYRKLLQGQLEAGTLDFEVSGKDRDTHARAKAAIEKRDRMRAALGISDSFIDGSSFEKINKKEDAPIGEKKQEEVSKKDSAKKKPKPKRRRKRSSSSSSSSSETSSSSDSLATSDSEEKSKHSRRSHSDSDSDSESDSDSDSGSSSSGSGSSSSSGSSSEDSSDSSTDESSPPRKSRRRDKERRSSSDGGRRIRRRSR